MAAVSIFILIRDKTAAAGSLWRKRRSGGEKNISEKRAVGGSFENDIWIIKIGLKMHSLNQDRFIERR